VSLAVVAQGWIRWALSDDFKAVDPGPDPFGGWKLAYLRGFQIVMPTVALFVVWRFLVRPLLKERRLTLDGMLILAIFTGWFYDPATVNLIKVTFTYNGHFADRGSWSNFIPGWHAPNIENFGEPLLFLSSAYIVWCFGFTLLAGVILRALRSRYPTMSHVTMFAIVAAMLFVGDLILEPLLFVWPEVWSYTNTVGWLTLWRNTPHQFPIYESLLVVPSTLCWVAIRWFRDDRGGSFVERGLDQLKLPARARRPVACLAVVGFAHVGFVSFVAPWNLISLNAETRADYPSYNQLVCGEGTDYACPGDDVPIPGKQPLQIRPDDPRLAP
jgi:hypothetical protein